MKVVLDTNVLIAAFKDEYSYQKRIINEIIGGRIEAFANYQTIRENRLILKREISNDEYRQELEDFFAQVVPIHNSHSVRVIADPEDSKILGSAVDAEADYLISEDKHLLEIGEYENVKIIEPIAFWKTYEEEIGVDPWQKWVKFISEHNG